METFESSRHFLDVRDLGSRVFYTAFDEVDVALALHVLQIIFVYFHDVAVALEVGRVNC